eukprot:5390185-Prymnesium_polylepis.2
MTLSALAFLANMAGKLYIGVPSEEVEHVKGGSTEHQLLMEKRSTVRQQQRASQMTLYECYVILVTLCIEDLTSLVFTSYVLVNKDEKESKSAQLANLVITSTVVSYS